MIQLDEDQLEAVERCVWDARDQVLTGGAGTGKTTIIKAIADRLEGSVVMCPTGKAAARVRQATGHDAFTIHRYLRWDGGTFRRSPAFEPLECPVIIDESSMIDSWLMARLVEFRPTKLILVGDDAQLPPVGAGQPFHDLIALCPEMVIRLNHCYRAAGAVHKASNAIRRGDAPPRSERAAGESFKILEIGGVSRTIEKIEGWVKKGFLDPTQDAILAPRYGDGESDAGIDRINAAVKAIVNPSDEPFAAGDRVLCNKNFAAIDLWNGDTGTITAINKNHMSIKLDRTQGDYVTQVTKEQRKEITHAYCLSVHKAQGSQFRNVFVVVQERDWHMLSRSLLYTAVTRAQKGVCVIGEVKAFYKGIGRVNKKTTVMQVLCEGSET